MTPSAHPPTPPDRSAPRSGALDDPRRRPIPQRSSPWAARTATALFRAGVRPNHISVASVLFAVLAGGALVFSIVVDDAARAALLLLAAVCIPLRLLCNMLDGMLAVECGLHGPTGELFNEVPDRVSDVVLFAGAGYAAAGLPLIPHVTEGTAPAPRESLTVLLGVTLAGDEAGGWHAASSAVAAVIVALGWTAGVLAVLTAYVRTLGVSVGTGQVFGGLLPKQRRMWLVVVGVLGSLAEPWLAPRGTVLTLVLLISVVGIAITVGTRLREVARQLREVQAP